MQIEQLIIEFTAEHGRTMKKLSEVDDKKEEKMLQKKLRTITTLLNNLLIFKSIINDD
jgi:hypothetical protein